MSQLVHEALRTGRDALGRHAWQEAFTHLKAADVPPGLSAEDLEGLAEAAWWVGRLADCVVARERAYGAYLEAGKRRSAGMVALALVRNYFGKRNLSVGAAWLKRAEQLLEQEPDSVEHGHLTRFRCVMAFEGARDYDGALIHAERTLEVGTRLGDRDLMALGLQDKGRILVAQGQVAQGMALLDEATVAAVSGELGAHATGVIYCNMISICEGLADYGRAGEWTDAARRWCERQAIGGFPGLCRVHRAGIMRVRGAWPEAEAEARRACEELRDFHLGYAAEAFYEVGEIRRRVGDLTGAEDAFRQAHELGRDPQPGLALLRLAEGKVDSARASVRSALADDSPDRLGRARLLPACVEIALAAGDLDTARSAVEELEGVASAWRTTALEASALCARGALQLAQGDAAAARRSLRRGCQMWLEVEAPYETAKARIGLAAACAAEGDRDAASLELHTAKSLFAGADRAPQRPGVPQRRRVPGQRCAPGGAHPGRGRDRRDRGQRGDDRRAAGAPGRLRAAARPAEGPRAARRRRHGRVALTARPSTRAACRPAPLGACRGKRKPAAPKATVGTLSERRLCRRGPFRLD